MHLGYMEFRLCPYAPETNEELINCLLSSDDNLLRRATPLAPGQQSDYKGTTPVWTSTQLSTRWRLSPLDGEWTGEFFKGSDISFSLFLFHLFSFSLITSDTK